MDFGRVDYEDLELLEFGLPPIHAGIPAPSKTKLFIGIPMWGVDKFKGSVYPKDAKKADFLQHFATQFDAIELNPTFYSLPPVERVRDWVETVQAVNPNFKFCPKIPESISHKGRIDHHYDELPFFFDVLNAFGETIGVSFLQLHEGFALSRFEELISFIEMWPNNYPLAIELRHPLWFKEGPIQSRLFEIMVARNVSWVITDTPGNQTVLHSNITAKHLIVRFVLTKNHPKDHERRVNWEKRLIELKNQGLEKIYFFCHEQDDELYMECINPLVTTLKDHYEIRLPIDYSTQSDAQLSLF